MPPPRDPLIGYSTDDLVFEALLGRGAMGAVYRGRQRRLDRVVAIKVVKPDLAADPTYLDRFTREAQTMGRLIHPHVVACHDFGPTRGPDGGDMLVMVLEYIDGATMGTLGKSGRLGLRATLEHYRGICEGLAAAHALGIIHRDIKPDNIMVTRTGVAKLADFGLARATDSQSLTRTGAILGSPAYMSPEASRGSEPGPPSDIYGVGCSLFHTLTGRPPYIGGSTLQVLHAHIADPVPTLAGLRPELAMLDGLMARCLAKDPQHRPTAATLSREISRIIQRLPTDVVLDPGTTPVTATSPAQGLPVITARPPAVQPRVTPVNRKLLLLGTVVVLLLVVVVAAASARRHRISTLPDPATATGPTVPAVTPDVEAAGPSAPSPSPASGPARPVLVQGATLPPGHPSAPPGAPSPPGEAPRLVMSQLGHIRLRCPADRAGVLTVAVHPGTGDQPRRLQIGPEGTLGTIDLEPSTWQLRSHRFERPPGDVVIAAADDGPFHLAGWAWTDTETDGWPALGLRANALIAPDVDALRSLLGAIPARDNARYGDPGPACLLVGASVTGLPLAGLQQALAESFGGGRATVVEDFGPPVEQAQREHVRWCVVALDCAAPPSGRSRAEAFTTSARQIAETGMCLVPMLTAPSRDPAGHPAWSAWIDTVRHALPGLPIIDVRTVAAFHRSGRLPQADASDQIAGATSALLDLRARIIAAARGRP